MRISLALLTALLAATIAAPAPAAVCQKPRQLKLLWDTKGNGQIVIVGYGCKMPSPCPTTDGQPATRIPLHVTLRAGDQVVFEGSLRPCDDKRVCQSLNSGGCLGGVDAHKAADGMIKFSYNRRGTASVMARVRASMGKPPELPGPVTATVTDGAGYSAEVTYTRCRSRFREHTATIVCR